MKFNVKDFPEHGISLIVPLDPSFGGVAKLPRAESTSHDDSYSVLLKNTGNRAVVGYSIKWECFEGKGNSSDRNVSRDRNVSNIVSWIFLHGDEFDRRAAVNGLHEIIKPHSTWLISFDSPSRPLEGGVDEAAFGTKVDQSGGNEILEGCTTMTIIADGIFFDDGMFIGPDTMGFFTEIKSQMDARYEILRGVRNALKSGKKPGEIFRELERVRDQEGLKPGEQPRADTFRHYFRNLFARDLLGKKELWGADKAIEDVQLQLSKPWVNLRKL
jgi:hypothetical protein